MPTSRSSRVLTFPFKAVAFFFREVFLPKRTVPLIHWDVDEHGEPKLHIPGYLIRRPR